MKERPILMNGEMVRATLRDINPKTQTRRLVKGFALECLEPGGFTSQYVAMRENGNSKLGYPGDRLYVRESWSIASKATDLVKVYYAASERQSHTEFHEYFPVALADGLAATWPKWKPSIHMPRWASRIDLEIVGLRIELLQDISEDDAKAEGCQPLTWDGTDGMADLIDWPLKSVDRPYANSFALLWESINGPGSWDANPWVWVVGFKRIEKEIAA